MNNIEVSKNLATYAVYKELYDSQKDSYDIIAEFIKSSLKKRSIFKFTAEDIVSFLKEDFDFQIPQSIVRTTLRNRLKFNRQDGYFLSTIDYESSDLDIDSKQKKVIENNEHIITNLFEYIEQQKNATLSEMEKEHISKEFSSFLLNENGIDSMYSQYISSYIILNQTDINFKKQLNMIKQGVILYSGVRYGEITEKRRRLQNKLIIYLDTEIIFHMAGYNGKLFKKLFDQFYELVKEFNSTKKRIYFKYFKITHDEINNYFNKAEELLNKRATVNPSKAAMIHILDGCKTKSDIVVKKTKLFERLELLNINLDGTETFLTKDTEQYNLLSTKLIDDLKKKGYNEYEIENSLDKLNAISILRGEKSKNNFNDIGFILLSGNNKIFNFAWNVHLKREGEVPLATSLEFLTNKFWLMLNKGFGDTNLPKTFDVVTKAQIILATSINSNINEKYEQLQKEVKQGNLTKERIIDTIYTLKNEIKKPEDINEETLSSILDSISITDLEEHQNQSIKLKEDFKNMKQLSKHTIQELIKEKEKRLLELENLKKIADDESDKKIKRYKVFWGLPIIISLIGIIVLIIMFGWDVMEKWTWIFFGLLPFGVSILYTIIYEKNLNLLNHFSHKKEEYTKNAYQKFKLDLDEINNLKKSIDSLQQNLISSK